MIKEKKLIFLLLLSVNSYAQNKNSRIIVGEVYSSVDSTALPFVNIYFKGKDIGTSSNIDGSFYLENPSSNKEKTLIFSHVSFQTKKVSLLTLDTLKVFLNPTVFTLGEVTVSAKNDDAKCLDIIKNAVMAMKNNYSTKTVELTFHYLETVKFNNQYGRFVEATGTIFDKPFDIKRKRKKKNRYSATINYYRASENYNSNFFPFANGIIHATNQNYIKYSASFLTNSIDNTKYQYQLDDTTTFHNKEVYKISFISKPHLSKTYPSGFIYITVDKHAIVALYTELNDKSFFEHHVSKDGKTSECVYMTTYIDYVPKGGIWVLNNIKKKEVLRFYNNITKTHYYNAEIDLILSVNEVKLSNPHKKPKDATDKYTNIYNRNYPYADSIWEEDILKYQSETIITRIKKDIERNGNTLEEQFKKVKNSKNSVYQREQEN